MKMKNIEPKVIAGALAVTAFLFTGCGTQKNVLMFQKPLKTRTEQNFGPSGNTHSINWQSGDTLTNLMIDPKYLKTPWRVLSWAKRVTGIDSLLATARLNKKLDWEYTPSQATPTFDREKTAITFQPEGSMKKEDTKIQIIPYGVMTNMDSSWVVGTNQQGAVWLSPNGSASGTLVCLPFGQTRPIMLDIETNKSAYYAIDDSTGMLTLTENGQTYVPVIITRAKPEKITLDNLKETDTRDRSENEISSVGSQANTKRITIEGHNNVNMAEMMQKYGLRGGVFAEDSTIVFPYSTGYALFEGMVVDARAGFTVTDKGAATITFPAIGNYAYVSSNYIGQILNKSTARSNLEVLPKGSMPCDYYAAYTSVVDGMVALNITSVSENGTVSFLNIAPSAGLENNTNITWKANERGFAVELLAKVTDEKGVPRQKVLAVIEIGARSSILAATSVEAPQDK